MPVISSEAEAAINALVERRLRAIDPLLPSPAALPAGCGAEFVTEPGRDQLSGIGRCVHWQGEPGSLEPTWGAERRFTLHAMIAGPQVETALDELLSQWRDHLAGTPDTRAEDTAAIVTWPSRDVKGIPTLLRRKFSPFGVLAARVSAHSERGHDDKSSRLAGTNVRIRRAGIDDIDAVVQLGLETVRFDAYFGCNERPNTAEALRRHVAGPLAGPEPWIWLAERDGAAIGLLFADRPEAAGWIAPAVDMTPVSYLMLAAVLAHERSSGVGAALVARYHHEVARAGVPVTLLHHEQTNPLSAPFWAQQGYRPLWTSWEARPAHTIR